MNLKLIDNPYLEITSSADYSAQPSTVSDNFKFNATGLMITGCPNVSALKILDDVKAYKAGHASTPGLKAIANMRLQLDPHETSPGTFTYGCTGTYDSLYGYSTMGSSVISGYESDGSERKKAGLVGKWTITDYIDDDMAEALSGSNGRYVVGAGELQLSADYRIDWDEMAVQCLDPKRPNYNPAVAVIFNSNSCGHVYGNTEHFAGSWWITKDEAAAMTKMGSWFTDVLSATDVDGIVSNDRTKSYSLTGFTSFACFSGIANLPAGIFEGAGNLKEVGLPSSLKSIPQQAFRGCGNLTTVGTVSDSVSSIQPSAFADCPKLSLGSIGNGVLEIGESAYSGCSKATFSSLPSSVRYVSDSAFCGCTGITVSEVPSSVGYIGSNAFKGCSSIASLHIGSEKPVPTMAGAFDGASYGIYLGTERSSWMAEHAKRVLGSRSGTSSYSSRLSSWYSKKYGERLGSGYEIQRFVNSDGVESIDTGETYENNTVFDTDVSFCATPTGTSWSVHGSKSVGLVGKKGVGVVTKLNYVEKAISDGDDFADSAVHNYRIDLADSRASVDGETRQKEALGTVGDGSPITMFGNADGKFSGTSWMGRISVNGAVAADYVPVVKTDGNVVGFYDVVGGMFYGKANYTSDSVSLSAANGESAFATEGGDGIIF